MENNKREIENNIVEIIKLLDKKILEKYDNYKRQISDQNELKKDLSSTQLKLMRLELLKEALLSGNSRKINAYNATQTNEKNKLKPNYNKLKSGNTTNIQKEIEEMQNKMNRISKELDTKTENVKLLSGKMKQMVDLLSKSSQKIKNNSNAQKKMINNIYKRTHIKAVKNILNKYYGNRPNKPIRNNSNLIVI